VLDTTFLYLALVRAAGVSSAVMDELASLSDVSCAYQEDSGGVANQVSRVASNLLEYEPKNVLSGPSMTLSPTQHASTVNSAAPHAAKVDDTVHATVESDSTTEMDAVLDIGHAFTPANTIITVALKSFAETAAEKTTSSSPNDQWQTEPWYGTLYREEPISPESLHRWQYAEEAEAQQRQNQEQQSDSPATNDSQDSTRVAAIVGGTRVWLRPVPLLNRFMPTAEMSKVAALTTKRADLVDLSSVASRGIDADTAAPGGNEERDVNVVSENESVEEEVPGVVRATRVVSGSENRRLAAWRVSPSKHLLGVPRLHATVHLLTPHAAGSPRQVVLAKLFCRLLLSDTNTALYDASCAGLAYDVTSTSDGLVRSKLYLDCT
jgi:secreted Zn-dependent insulinase-like peptidase